MNVSIAFSTVVVILLAIVSDSHQEVFKVYECPLNSSLSSLNSCNRRRDPPYGQHERDIQHGLQHTYIQIGETCYDWGNWNYARSMPCNDNRLYCCRRSGSLVETRSSSCSGRVGEFENAWSRNGYVYDFLFYNCQRYTNWLRGFLLRCPSNAEDALSLNWFTALFG